MAAIPRVDVLDHVCRLFEERAQREMPDRQLLGGFVRQRDEAAFTALVRRYGPLVLVLAIGLLGGGVLAVGHPPPAARQADRPPAPATAAAADKGGFVLARGDRDGDPLPGGALLRLGTIRLRHGGSVNGVSFSPDGKVVASCGGFSDPTVRLWGPATGQEVRHFREPGWKLSAVVFSPDGTTLASDNGWGVLHPRDVATGAPLWAYGSTGPLTGLAYAPDGKTLAAAWEDNTNTVHLFDARTGGQPRQIAKHPATIRRLAWSPDGKTLATGCDDGIVRLWDAGAGREIRPFKGHGEPIRAVAFSPDGKTLASAGKDRTIRLWDVATGKERHRLTGHEADVLAVAFAPDGKTLASGGADWTLRRWDVAAGREKGPPLRHLGAVSSVAYSPDGKLLASGGDDKENTLRLWEAATGAERCRREGHHGWVGLLRLAGDGRTLFSACSGGEVRRWDLATGRPLPGSFVAQQSRAKAADFSPGGLPGPPLVAAGSSDHTIYLREIPTGKLLRRFHGHEAAVKSVGFSPDGRLLISAGEDRTIRLWDVATGRELRRLQGPHQAVVWSFLFLPDGKTVLTGDAAGRIQAWDLATGQERFALSGHEMAIERLVLSPDHRLLASASHDGTIRLWDLAARKELRRMGHDGAYCYNVVFSPDGRSLASASGDRILRIWETATGQLRKQLEGHRGAVASVLFAPDGKTLFSGSSDTTILLWDLTGRMPDGRWRSVKLSDRELQAAWDDLSAGDAGKAYQALWTLAAAPAQAVPLLRRHLHPVQPVEEKRLARLLADLDSDAFAVRARAMTELEQLGPSAESGLRRLVAKPPSLEARRRAEQLLDNLDEKRPTNLRLRRALEALEQMGTPEAKELAADLAKGEPNAWLTREAKATLGRLKHRPASAP